MARPLVYEGVRPATLDIDITVEVEAQYHGPLMREVARLKDQLGVNVEEAAPADFIPVPSGWRERSVYVGRFGQIDVFHYDSVSTALSKLSRGLDRDLADVRAMLQRAMLTRESLLDGWREMRANLPDWGWSESEIHEVEALVDDVLRPDGADG